ncbi:MAG: nucleotide sugar dehydrogenase [Clostridia bacterium]|nr:nucleotide sugar dehydrogenase [Clostridia bacterium]
MKEVCIIGLGYIGLPTAAMFATHGVKVKGVDVKQEICDTINGGQIHIEEPYLADLVKQSVLKGMICCSTKVESTEAYIIAVPTPITSDKKADLSYVVSAGEKVAKVLQKGDLVILESTVSPRCTIDVLRPVLEKSGLIAGEDFYLAHCPERVLPGQIIYELEHNNRVIGGINDESAEKAKDLYSTFVKGEIYVTDTITAELCKLMENTYRDVNIALANELAKICEKLGCNAWDVIKYANKHPRVNLHTPGPGVGGHCLAVDPWFIVEATEGIAQIIDLSRKTNDSMPSYVAEKISALVPEKAKIVILGCTYKPDVDDMRESPIMELVHHIKDQYMVQIVDPFIEEFDKNIYEVSNDADLIILGVHHKKFKDVSFEVLAKIMKKPVLLDTRNFFNKEKVEKFGFAYHLIGCAR